VAEGHPVPGFPGENASSNGKKFHENCLEDFVPCIPSQMLPIHRAYDAPAIDKALPQRDFKVQGKVKSNG
jgi:hypothetical protein